MDFTQLNFLLNICGKKEATIFRTFSNHFEGYNEVTLLVPEPVLRGSQFLSSPATLTAAI